MKRSISVPAMVNARPKARANVSLDSRVPIAPYNVQVYVRVTAHVRRKKSRARTPPCVHVKLGFPVHIVPHLFVRPPIVQVTANVWKANVNAQKDGLALDANRMPPVPNTAHGMSIDASAMQDGWNPNVIFKLFVVMTVRVMGNVCRRGEPCLKRKSRLKRLRHHSPRLL